jgi:ABC-type transport system substrate-binding protein
MDLFEDNPDYVVLPYIYNNGNPVAFNMTDPICGDYNFRMAVMHCIDKEEHAYAYNGRYAIGAVDMGSIWGRYTEFRNRDIEPIAQDFDKAKEYLDKSVYNGETIEVACLTVGQRDAGPLFQQQLEKIGVKTEIRLLENASAGEYLGWGKNDLQILLTTAPLTMTTASFRNYFYPGTTGQWGNVTNYDNPEVTRLMDEAQSEIDYEKRAELWYKIQELVAADRPYENLNYFVETVVGAKGVGGLRWPIDLSYDFRYVYWNLDA